MDRVVIDEVFGELTFTFAWTKDVDQTFYGKNFKAGLIVDGNDEDETILEEQREAYKRFQENESEIIAKAERAVYEYYNEVCYSIASPQIKESEIADHVELTGIVFPMVLKRGEISIGFLFEADCDPEHGIGVKIINDEIEEVSTQDILT